MMTAKSRLFYSLPWKCHESSYSCPFLFYTLFLPRYTCDSAVHIQTQIIMTAFHWLCNKLKLVKGRFHNTLFKMFYPSIFFAFQISYSNKSHMLELSRVEWIWGSFRGESSNISAVQTNQVTAKRATPPPTVNPTMINAVFDFSKHHLSRKQPNK